MNRYDDVNRCGFNEDEIEVHASVRDGASTTMSLDAAAKLDDPEGVVIVAVSATLYRELVQCREAARILAADANADDSDDSSLDAP